MASPIIRTEKLVKRFGKVEALKGIDLEVYTGTVLGLLGPNGAGKTTGVRILTTLLQPDGGSRRGRRPRRRARRRGAAVPHRPRGPERRGRREPDRPREPRDGRTALPPRAGKEARRRAGEVLERFGLSDAGDRPAKTYSGGMRRRLDVAASLVGRPDVLFLDEPTTGLDPRSRLDVWEFIREMQDEGTTLLLTTQYLEEADQLADRIAVDRPRERDRRGNIRRAEGPHRRRGPGAARRAVGDDVAEVAQLLAGRRHRRAQRRRRPGSRPAAGGQRRTRRACSTASGGSTRRRSRWPTSRCTARRSTTCSCRSRARVAEDGSEPEGRAGRARAATRSTREAEGGRMSAVAVRAPSNAGSASARHQRRHRGRIPQPGHALACAHRARLRARAADHVRAAVPLHLCEPASARVLARRRLRAVPDARHLRAERDLRVHDDRDRHRRRPQEGHHRPVPVAADGPVGRPRRADHGRPREEPDPRAPRDRGRLPRRVPVPERPAGRPRRRRARARGELHVLLDLRHGGPVAQGGRGGPGGRVHADLPDRVRELGVRAGRRHGIVAAADRRAQPRDLLVQPRPVPRARRRRHPGRCRRAARTACRSTRPRA